MPCHATLGASRARRSTAAVSVILPRIVQVVRLMLLMRTVMDTVVTRRRNAISTRSLSFERFLCFGFYRPRPSTYVFETIFKRLLTNLRYYII